jgi:hypothetical protein
MFAWWMSSSRQPSAQVATVNKPTPDAKQTPKRPEPERPIPPIPTVATPATQSGPAIVAGRAITLDANPAADARIEVKLLDGFGGPPVSPGRESRQAVCDSEGAFAVRQLRHGYYAVLARLGNDTAVKWVWLRPRADTVNLLMILRPGLQASGRVEDESGSPIANALLEPVLHDGGRVERRVVQASAVLTGDQGDFNFFGLEPTTWEVCITADGYGPLRAPLQLGPAENRFVLRKGAGITGTVVDATDGSAIPGAVVTALERDIEMTPIRTRTGPDGTFSFPPVPPGRYLLDIESDPLVLSGGPREVEVRDESPEPVTLKALAGGSVYGHALDAVTREGIAGVYLRAWPKQKWVARKAAPPTGADGAFTFTGLAESEYEINVAGVHGYNRTSLFGKKPVVRVAAGEEIADVEVLLFRGGVISGVVVDPEGHPVAGATVKGRSTDKPWQDQCDSEADGHFTLAGLDGESKVTLSASSPKWTSEVMTDIHVPKEGVQDVTITMTLARSASVAGVVVNGAGQPVRVKLMAESRTRPLSISSTLAETAADGRFVLANLFEDEFDISGFVGNGQKYPLATVRVRAGETLRGQRWVMPTGNATIMGKVVDGAGKPVAARIEYRHLSGSDASPAGNVSAGPDGAFTISGIEEGEFLLSVSSKGYASQQMVPAQAGDTGLVVILEEFEPITGHVLDANTRQPIMEFEVASVDVRTVSEDQIPGDAAFRAMRDPAGAFSLELEDGFYLIVVRTRGYTLARANAETGPGLPPVTLEFALQPGGATVEGRVVDSGGAAVQGALVFVGPLPPNAEHNVARSSARTDDAGAFRIEGLEAGPIELSAVHTVKGIGSVSGELRSDVPTELTIVLNSPGGVEGVVTYAGEPMSRAAVRVTMHSGASGAAMTTDTGQYSIKGLPQGTGVLRVDAAELPEGVAAPEPETREVAITGPETVTVDIALTPK